MKKPSLAVAFLGRDSVVLMRAWHYTRCSIGSSELDTALAAPSLGIALAAPG